MITIISDFFGRKLECKKIVIHFLHELAVFSVKNANIYSIFLAKIFKIITSNPEPGTPNKILLQSFREHFYTKYVLLVYAKILLILRGFKKKKFAENCKKLPKIDIIAIILNFINALFSKAFFKAP
jgi:hypothetical protein